MKPSPFPFKANRMPPLLRRVFATVFAVAIAGSTIAEGATPQVATAPPFEFRPGDRCCVIGDSITHGGEWLRFVELYYLTRFPTLRFDLFNCGIGGDTADGALRRLDWDVLERNPTSAILMLGMNDVWFENGKLIGPGDYIRDIKKLLVRLAAADCRVLLMSPSIYDGTAKNETSLAPRREGLEPYVEELHKLAAERKIPFLDIHTPMQQLTRAMQAKDPALTLLAQDRVHPNQAGNLEMASVFLKFQQVPSQVSSLVLDAARRQALPQIDCQIKDLVFGTDGLSVSVLEKALPFPMKNIHPQSLEWVPWEQEFNQEMFRVTGLAPGDYELKIDDIVVTRCSSAEWESGINLAKFSVTPQQRQAEEIDRLQLQRFEIFSQKIRWMLMLEFGELHKVFPPDDTKAPQPAIEAFLKLIPDPEQRAREQQKYQHYLDLKANQSKFLDQAQKLMDQIRSNQASRWHHYEIRSMQGVHL